MWNNTRVAYSPRHRYIEKFQSPCRSERLGGAASKYDRDWCGECNFLRLRRAFILRCTFSVRPDLSRANLRICINTIRLDSRGNSSGVERRMLSSRKCAANPIIFGPTPPLVADRIAAWIFDIDSADWKSSQRKHWGNKQSDIGPNGERSFTGRYDLSDQRGKRAWCTSLGVR